MGAIAFLAAAGLLVALAIALGLWGWRRLLRTTSLNTTPRAAALRASAPHVASGDADIARESPRTNPTGRAHGGSCSKAAVDPVALLPESLGTAVPAHAADEGAAPGRADVLQEPPRPPEPRPVEPPSPPLAEEATAPTVPASSGDGADCAEQDLLASDAGEKALATGSRGAVEPHGTPTPEAALPSQPPEPPVPGLPPLRPPAEDAAALAVREPNGGGTKPAEQAPLPPPDDEEQVREADGQVAVEADDAPTDEDGATSALNPCSTADAPHDADSAHDPSKEGVASSQPDICPEEPPPGTKPEDGDLPTAAADKDTTQNAAPAEADFGSDPAPETPVGRAPRPRQPAIHRDRRGKRRAVAAAAPSVAVAAASGLPARPPAEAKLRLSLHPIRRAARLSVVLTRPDGFPSRVTIQGAASHAVEAYDEQRYDDLDLPWTSELLDGELRLASADGFQWLRSARQVHLFVQDPNEPELISVSAARAGIAHALICRSGDAEAVRLAARSTGSADLHTNEHWQGVPDGWTVLSGYTPMHAAATPLPTGLRTLDPGEGLEIGFEGGLALRGRVYAAGHPPRILILPAPGAASVTIGGHPAALSSDGAWTAPGWDAPGQHIVDVVPGPSVSYEIVADPWLSGGWDFWDAHPDRFADGARQPWAQARICGALVRGQADEMVFAAETQPTLVALGARSGATPLWRRPETGISVGLLSEPPAFLLAATGARRSQGRIVWLGLAPAQRLTRVHDAEWVAIVRSAAARRLPLVQADALGEDSWRKAKERARRLRNRRPRR